jgi:signal peptidase I
MTDIVSPRGLWSTFAISFISNGIGGLLWIGRPRLAFALCTLVILCFYSVLAGWLPVPQFLPLSILQWIAIAVLTLIPLILRTRSVPSGWLSKLVPAVAIPVILSAMVALSIRSLAYQPFNSVSNSMAPTLIEGDVFVANKSVYGYSRYSFPFEAFDFSGRTTGSLPERGDVVLFRANGNDYVKRIIGLPGETIQMINGLPVINGVVVEQQAIRDYLIEPEGRTAMEIRETLPDGRNYSVLDLQKNAIGDDTRKFIIPESSYFVLGDHRDNSIDSRFEMGFVSHESLIGRADLIFGNEEGLEFVSRKSLNFQ